MEHNANSEFRPVSLEFSTLVRIRVVEMSSYFEPFVLHVYTLNRKLIN